MRVDSLCQLRLSLLLVMLLEVSLYLTLITIVLQGYSQKINFLKAVLYFSR